MIQDLQLNLALESVDRQGKVDKWALGRAVAQALRLPPEKTGTVVLQRLSLDARPKIPCYQARVRIYTAPDTVPEEEAVFPSVLLGKTGNGAFSGGLSVVAASGHVGVGFPSGGNASHPRRVLVAGMGPAGLFAALALASAGVHVVVLERGKNVRERKRDIARFCRTGILDPDSNYAFGEGGAGCFSDGKLYTRSNKRGDIGRVLRTFVHYGAKEEILYQAHPHLGSDRMPGMVERMRQDLLEVGAEVHFGTKVESILRDAKGCFIGLRDQVGNEYRADALVLAVGNSAGELWRRLLAEGIGLEEKPLAMGVRLEHPQALINAMQYKGAERRYALPPAEYSFVEQLDGNGVFSFCMCPGGVVVPASTEADGLVVNGMSDSGRNSPWANSGWVTGVSREILAREGVVLEAGPLALWEYQRALERKFFQAGGTPGSFSAPAQRMMDFVEGRNSRDLPASSYAFGIYPALMDELLPAFIVSALRGAFHRVSAKKRGFLTNEAILLGFESRTSCPVRIPRDTESGEHPQVPGLYPCGEGSGYAGGITSSAMDGLNTAGKILAKWGMKANFAQWEKA